MATVLGKRRSAEPPQEDLSRRLMHEDVLDRLRDMIVDGSLSEGEIIPELELCGKWNISRTPIREALKVLASEGLVSSQPRRGSLVLQLTGPQVEEMIEVLAELEGSAAVLACKHASDEKIAQFRRLNDRMITAYKRKDWKTYFQINMSIHDFILEMSGNSYLIEMHNKLSKRLRKIRYNSNTDENAFDLSVSDHMLMVKLMENREQIELRSLAIKHVNEIIR